MNATKTILMLVLAVTIQPDDPVSPEMARANRYFVHERYEAAAELYARAARAGEADAAEAAYLLGRCHDRMGSPERAVEAYRQVLDNHAASPWALDAGNALGDAFVQMNRWQEALDSYEWVANRVPDSTPGYVARLNIANLYQNPFNDVNGDFAVALENFHYVADNGGAAVSALRPQIYFGMGESLRNLGRPDEAIDAYTRCVSADPRGVWGAAAQNMIGTLRMQMRQFVQAEEAFQNTARQYGKQQVFQEVANQRLKSVEESRLSNRARIVANVVDIEQQPSANSRPPSSVVFLQDEVRVEASRWRMICDSARWDDSQRVLHCNGSVRLYSGDALLFTAESLSFQPPMDQSLDIQDAGNNTIWNVDSAPPENRE